MPSSPSPPPSLTAQQQSAWWRTPLLWSAQGDTSLVAKAAAEFMGCMMFHFIGSVSPTPAANAVALMVLVHYTAKISGGHLNPAATLTFAVLGHTNPLELLAYWAAQVAGCITGGLWIAALVPQLRIGRAVDALNLQTEIEHAGCVNPHIDLTDAQIFGWEAVATFCFLVPVMSVVWYTQHKSGYGNTGPIMIGLSLYAVALATGGWTGAFVNPARVFGSHAVFRCAATRRVPAYIAGQIAGALATPLAILPWYGLAAQPWWATTHTTSALSRMSLTTTSQTAILARTRAEAPNAMDTTLEHHEHHEQEQREHHEHHPRANLDDCNGCMEDNGSGSGSGSEPRVVEKRYQCAMLLSPIHRPSLRATSRPQTQHPHDPPAQPDSQA